MARREYKKISDGEAQYKEIITGGPLKVYNRRRVRVKHAKKAKFGYEMIDSLWYRDLIEKVTAARCGKGMTQRQLAGLLGTTQAEISRLEGGKLNPTVEFLDRLITILELEIEVERSA